jgi:hypothetical protein
MNDPQLDRAHRIATQLGAGPNPPHGLIKALQALVEADERYIEDAPPRRRQPLTITKTAIPEPEKELTLF